MSKGKQTLDELLSDPMIRLVMARERVRPEEVWMLLSKAMRPKKNIPAAHVIAGTCDKIRPTA